MKTVYTLEYRQGNSKNELHTILENNAMDCFESIKSDCSEFTFKKTINDIQSIDKGFKISYENYMENILS